MEKGIIILAFGKRGYGFAAYNLAKTIKHYSPSLHITLCHDDVGIGQLNDLSVFDSLQKLPTEHVSDPAKIKVSVYDLSQYEHTLYVDADCVALKDISPLLEQCINSGEYYQTLIVDSGGKNDTIAYSSWATNEKIWNHFKLSDSAQLPSIQSSYCYFNKKAKAFFDKVKENYNFPIKDLSVKWGGTLPDELIFSGTCAQLGIIPIGNDAVFFGNSREIIPPSYIIDNYYFLTLYGSGRQKTVKLRYVDWYDRMLNQMFGQTGFYKAHYILKDKHVDNGKK